MKKLLLATLTIAALSASSSMLADLLVKNDSDYKEVVLEFTCSNNRKTTEVIKKGKLNTIMLSSCRSVQITRLDSTWRDKLDSKSRTTLEAGLDYCLMQYRNKKEDHPNKDGMITIPSNLDPQLTWE